MLKPIKNIKKTEQLKKQLVAIVKDLEPGERIPSVRRLNEELKISTSTIDRVLSELSEEGVIKRKHGKGIFANPDFFKITVGIIIGMDIFEEGLSPFYRELVQELKNISQKNNFSTSIFFESYLKEIEDENEKVKYFMQANRDGAIVINGRTEQLYNIFKSNDINIVGHACKFEIPFSVEIDNKQIVESGLETLKKNGCKRIAIITISSADSRKIIDKYLRDGTVRKSLIWEYELFSQNKYSASNEQWEMIGYRAAKDLLSKNDAFDGLLITDDMIAKGALNALQEAGLCGNRDSLKIAVQSNKGSDALWQYENRLIRMEINPAEVAENLLEKLSKLLSATRNNYPEKTTYIKSKLIMERDK